MEGPVHNRRVNNICVLVILIMILNMCLVMGYLIVNQTLENDVLFLFVGVCDCIFSGVIILCVYGINAGKKLMWYIAVILCVLDIIWYVPVFQYTFAVLINIIVLSSALLMLLDKEVRAQCSIGKLLKG